jgi:hypothetical protein
MVAGRFNGEWLTVEAQRRDHPRGYSISERDGDASHQSDSSLLCFEQVNNYPDHFGRHAQMIDLGSAK